jgi:hypothetical protein
VEFCDEAILEQDAGLIQPPASIASVVGYGTIKPRHWRAVISLTG